MGETRRFAKMTVLLDVGDWIKDPCECGHSKESHEGHTHREGTPEPSHCSQWCGCREYRQKKAMT